MDVYMHTCNFKLHKILYVKNNLHFNLKYICIIHNICYLATCLKKHTRKSLTSMYKSKK